MCKTGFEGEITLESVQRHFEQWRLTRAKKGKIPEKLWDEAAALVGRHSISHVARHLKLNHSDLKRQCERTRAAGQPSNLGPEAFVELKLAGPEGRFQQGRPCLLELQAPGGTSLKLYSADGHHLDLPGVIRAFGKRLA